MKYSIVYGQDIIDFNLSEELNVDLFQAKQESSIENPKQALINSFSNPLLSKSLKEILNNRKEGYICIVISDATRKIPSMVILEALMIVFDELNIHDDQIKILIANGMHRKCTPNEIKEIVGKEVLFRYDVLNHVAEDEQSLDFLGETSR